MNEIRLYPWELESMRNYSSSMPTGVVHFKMWRCADNRSDCGWLVCQYVPIEPYKLRGQRQNFDTATRVFRVVLRHGPKPRRYDPPDWDNFQRYQRGNPPAMPDRVG